jgi:hypothetical protein
VLVNARPEAPWQDVIRAVDLAHRLGAHDVVLATPGEEPPQRGLRVNGLGIEELSETEALPSPLDHPAVSRIIHL